MSSAYESQPLTGSLISRKVVAGLPRSLELVLAGGFLVILSPLLVVCAVLVITSSAGPVFFRQLRVGRNGKVFRLFKFRTMRVSQNGLLITASTDYRITPIGRFLRKWKLDELPELYNVLKGEMSFVGPRPEVPELVDLSCPLWGIILSARPGITDPVTLTLRDEEAVLAMAEDKEHYYRAVIQPYKLKGYIRYLEVKSFWRDIAVIVRTLKVILSPRREPQKREVIDLFQVD
jgi:lipopolysaccharide/colanic/teichoic acid biosynthesis glycosyltransferase